MGWWAGGGGVGVTKAVFGSSQCWLWVYWHLDLFFSLALSDFFGTFCFFGF